MERSGDLAFSGFANREFEVFLLPDFGTRMPALKAAITPKLKELGDALAPRLSETYGSTLYPHVAQHLRRSVNAPVATWVAFAKERRAYKPFVHLRAAITADEFRMLVFVEDYADEKETFGANLIRFARPLCGYLRKHPSIRAYTIVDKKDIPLGGKRLDTATLKEFGERMVRVKGQHAVFGIAWNRADSVVASGNELVEALVDAAKELQPLYVLGEQWRQVPPVLVA
jgi:uncharacterized protein YktB (UPF0637 family)